MPTLPSRYATVTHVRHVNSAVRSGDSGVAKLGHTGARALATRGCAPPVQALSVPNVNRELVHKGVEIELRSIAIWNNEVSYAPLISVYMYACML